MPRYDAAVVGCGAMGSAALWQLARRGMHVLGIDRHDPPHALGSTHGRSRIIREAYFEHPSYVPLVRRAYELWTETEEASGERLFLPTRGLMIGDEAGEIVTGSLASAREYGIPHELLTADEVSRRFPVLRPASGMVALLEQRAGVLFPEEIVRAHLRLAVAAGAELLTATEIVEWTLTDSGVQLSTSDGRLIEAGQVVFAAGSWLPDLVRNARIPLSGERQTMHWFVPLDPAGFSPEECPIAVWDDPHGAAFATFPDLGDGVKIAVHHDGVLAHPDSMERGITPEDERAVRERLARYVPTANGAMCEAAVCIYANTPDSHFVIDWLHDQRVLVTSVCSGHGFKFASAIGELVAQLVAGDRPTLDISLFALDRFAENHGEQEA